MPKYQKYRFVFALAKLLALLVCDTSSAAGVSPPRPRPGDGIAGVDSAHPGNLPRCAKSPCGIEVLFEALSAGLTTGRVLLVEITVEVIAGVTASTLLVFSSASGFSRPGRAADPRFTSNHVCAWARSASGLLAHLSIRSALSCWVVGVEPESTDTSMACPNAALA